MFKKYYGVLFLPIVIGVAGCGKQDGVVNITEERTVNVTPDTLPAGHPPVSPNAAPAAQSGFDWTTPDGWEELPPANMRPVNLRLAGNPATECYVTVLAGGGGGIEANINRWRTQMNLPSYSPDEVAALPQIPLLDGEAVYVEFTGKYQGMGTDASDEDYLLMGAVLSRPDDAVFVKFVGPANALNGQQEAFKTFCASLSKAAAAPQGDPHAGLPAPAMAPLSIQWVAPDGWTKAPDRTMRLVTYTAGDAEAYIAVLPGQAGGMEANLNRWYEQMGQSAPSDFSALPQITVLGQTVPIVESHGKFTDMAGVTNDDYALLGVAVTNDDSSVFIKMTGPSETIAAERDRFIAFCESLTR